MSELSVGQLKGLPVNSNVVTVPSGHKLYAPGHVLQVVHGTENNSRTSSTNTPTTTGLTATITPTSASSKILVLINQNGVGKTSGNTGVYLWLYRGASQIVKIGDSAGYTNDTTQNFIGSVSATYLDSPATTSAVTYTTYFASSTNVAAVYVQASYEVSTITLMEIAA